MSDANAAQPWVDLALAPWRLAMQATQTWPMALAPQSLTQPINPGWTFGNLIQVTEQNSTAPDTEQEIVRRHSYGRQIGRMMDAVDLLIDHAPAAVKKDPRATELKKIQRDVDAIKKAQQGRRVEQLRAELRQIRESDATAWRELSREFTAAR
jgi:hypothetical protein